MCGIILGVNFFFAYSLLLFFCDECLVVVFMFFVDFQVKKKSEMFAWSMIAMVCCLFFLVVLYCCVQTGVVATLVLFS
jgi:hypothetical protein